MTTLITPRLRLVPMGRTVLRALADDHSKAERLLAARIPQEYPGAGMRRAIPALLPPSDDPGAAVWGPWALVDARRGWLLGDAGFKGPPDEEGVVEIGYRVLPRMRRRGYASEAVAELVRWALSQGGASRVVALIHPGNEASQRVIAAAGARCVARGPRRPDELWLVTPGDSPPAPGRPH